MNIDNYKTRKKGKKTTIGLSTLTKYGNKGSKSRYKKRYRGQGK